MMFHISSLDREINSGSARALLKFRLSKGGLTMAQQNLPQATLALSEYSLIDTF